MELKKLLFYMTVISTVSTKSLKALRDNRIADLKWLFDDTDEMQSNEVRDIKYTVCDTKQCQTIADDFKRGMNKSMDPCLDFHEYVCGNWKKYNPRPNYEILWGRLPQFQRIVSTRIKGILEIEPETSDILPVRQAKKWYRSCMDTDVLERRGLKPLESILIQIGGWPMTMDREEWNEEDHTWQSIEEHYFHITGSYIFYKVTAQHDEDSGITLANGDFPLDDINNNELRNYTGSKYDDYMKLIEGIIEIFIDEHKADVSKKMIKKEIRDLVEFEKKLYLLNDEDFDTDPTTIDDLIQTYNAEMSKIQNENNKFEKIDFRRVIRRVFDMINYDIEDSTPLYGMSDSKYWIQLTKILNETPKRTIVNYIHWYFVSNMIKYTTENMRNFLFKYQSNEFGVEARRPRWLECVYEMKMSIAASYAFTQKYFHGHTETDVRIMIDHIRDEIKSQIEKTTWLDDESKELAIDKLKAMKIFLGFPDWYKNKTRVLNAYKGLTIGSDYFGNILSYQRYNAKRALQKTTSDITIDPIIVNAYYYGSKNTIELPAADFQSPLFTSKLPHSINYGVTGVVIGHEMGHGFDDHGIKLGKDGNATKISKYIMDMYYQRAECFLQQYNQYLGVTESDYTETTPEYYEGSFGRRTRGENIADLTGLDSVYEAYRKMIEKLPNGDYKLPGFEEYSDSQMFFISFAAMLCDNIHPTAVQLMEKYDSHSPARLRIIGAVSNTNDFARAFNCPKGSPMNPDNKCNIWKSTKKRSDEQKKSEQSRRSN